MESADSLIRNPLGTLVDFVILPIFRSMALKISVLSILSVSLLISFSFSFSWTIENETRER